MRYIEDPLKQPKPGDVGAQQLLVTARVANYRSTRCEVKLRVDVFVDGQLFLPQQQTLRIEPRRITKADEAAGKEEDDRPGEKGMDIKLPPLDLGKHIVLHAYLDKHKDDFALDDEAWLAVSVLRKAKVLIVGPPNSVLDAFFDQEATARLATFERRAPDELGTEAYRKHARGGDVDLVIFDRCAPATEADLPLANTFFIGAVPPPWQQSKTTFRPLAVIPSKGNHPLLRLPDDGWGNPGIGAGVRVRRAQGPRSQGRPSKQLNQATRWRTIPTRSRSTAAACCRRLTPHPGGDAGQRPLLFSSGALGRTLDLVQTFPLVGDNGDLVTDWPLQPSFPLFFRNVLYTLGKVDDAVRAAGVQPGEPMVLRPEAGVDKLEVTVPGGGVVTLERAGSGRISCSATPTGSACTSIRPRRADRGAALPSTCLTRTKATSSRARRFASARTAS